jgi:hypothetical protein
MLSRIAGNGIVIVIAVLQFTHVFEYPVGKWIVLALALAAVTAGIVSEFQLRKAEQTREANQEERDRKLAVAAVSEYVHRASSVQMTASSQIEEHDMSADDPRIYVEIRKADEAMFKRTPFVLHNRGKDVAHGIRIRPFKLKRKDVLFPVVEAIPAESNADILPEVAVDQPMNEHDIFHWLMKDWDGNGELVDEWPIPITVEYTDFSKKKKFQANMNLVFHPIRYLLDEKHNWPQRNHEPPLWEFRDIEFKRVE